MNQGTIVLMSAAAESLSAEIQHLQSMLPTQEGAPAGLTREAAAVMAEASAELLFLTAFLYKVIERYKPTATETTKH